MFDFRVVCVYPLPESVEDLEVIDPSIVDQLEASIASTIEDGWEYMFTNSFSEIREHDRSRATRVKTFVYRRTRMEVEVEADGKRATLSTEFNEREERNVFSNIGPTVDELPPPPLDDESLETIAILNALYQRLNVPPRELLADLQENGEISATTAEKLATTLSSHKSAAEIAAMTPTGKRHQVFTASVLPFQHADTRYVDYISELAVHLELDEDFVSSAMTAKKLAAE